MKATRVTKQQNNSPSGAGACTCHGMLHEILTLAPAVAKNSRDLPSGDADFALAMREVLAAHFETATTILQRRFDELGDSASGFLLAQCFRLQHRYREMVTVYEEMARSRELSRLMSFELALGYLNLGVIERALPLLEAVDAHDDGEEAVAYHLAEAYFRAGRLMSAIATLRKALPRHPASRRISDFLARLEEVSDP